MIFMIAEVNKMIIITLSKTFKALTLTIITLIITTMSKIITTLIKTSSNPTARTCQSSHRAN